MSTIATRNVRDLPPHSRQHVEEILGCALNEDQRIFVIVDALYPKPAQAMKTTTDFGRRS